MTDQIVPFYKVTVASNCQALSSFKGSPEHYTHQIISLYYFKNKEKAIESAKILAKDWDLRCDVNIIIETVTECYYLDYKDNDYKEILNDFPKDELFDDDYNVSRKVLISDFPTEDDFYDK